MMMPVQAASVPLHNGLLSYWALDEKAGSTAFDSAPGGVVSDSGSLRNGPSWIDGIFGAGVQLNGTNQDILIPNSLDMDIGTSAVSISAWVKLDQLPADISGSFSGIFDSQPDNYVLYLDKGNDELRFKVTTTAGGAARPGVPASLLNTTEWLHVMGVYGGEGEARIYYNGELAGALSASGLTANVRSGQVAGIGSQVTAGAPHSSSSLFKGAIADMGVWNRALGLAEARYLYNEGAGNAIGAANPAIEPILPDPPDNPSIIVEAHRGNSVAAPENTLSAIIAAAGFADYVEFDVRVTRDNRLVLMHDGSLNRTTNGSGSVDSRDYVGYIDGLDAGSWFSSEFTGEVVPTMTEAVQTTFAHGMTPLIERKAGSAAAYVDELNGLGVLDESVIIAFDWDFLEDVRALNSEVKLGGLGSGSLTASTVSNAVNAGLDFIDWGDGGSISESTVAMVHAAGLELHVWTVNSLTRMQELIDLGVDGITTDAPETLRSIVPFPSIPGDYNGDGNVNLADYTVWRNSLGSTVPAGTGADGTGDGLIDTQDYTHWKSNFSFSSAGVATSLGVPEPTGLSVLLVGSVVGLSILRRPQTRSSRVNAELMVLHSQ
ncbi:glycerophosphodiester phosphodiesterase family protein [Aeoliella sp.]|uniref:glycerophosphodiester phosphodiesterase family protein n=1 Tax=Aeoliella sp. TaxID=2795800 RepID=UPI003CCBF0AC